MPKAKPRSSGAAASPAEIVREYGPFYEGEAVHGVSHDGQRVWFATGQKLRALDPVSGELSAELDAVCDAGTAFDGACFYQLGAGRIQKLDARTGQVLASLRSPGNGRDAGLTWAEGKLWVAKYDEHTLYEIDPRTGEVLKTVEATRFVTGVTWVEGELWHGTLEDGVSELHQVRPEDGALISRVEMPEGALVTGLEWDGGGLFYCGGGASGKLRAVKRPRRR